jgi:hypothetical protein
MFLLLLAVHDVIDVPLNFSTACILFKDWSNSFAIMVYHKQFSFLLSSSFRITSFKQYWNIASDRLELLKAK